MESPDEPGSSDLRSFSCRGAVFHTPNAVFHSSFAGFQVEAANHHECLHKHSEQLLQPPELELELLVIVSVNRRLESQGERASDGWQLRMDGLL